MNRQERKVMAQQIEDQLEQQIPLAERMDLIENIHQGEELLKMSLDESRRIQSLEALDPYYQMIDQILSTVATMMEYSLVLDEWVDSIPLDMMAETFPGIDETLWYQNKWKIITGM